MLNPPPITQGGGAKYAQRSLPRPKTLVLLTCSKLQIVFSKKVNKIPPPCNGPEVLSSTSDVAKLLAETWSENSQLDIRCSSIPTFPYRTNLKLHDISITPKMVKVVKMIINVLVFSVISAIGFIPGEVLNICDIKHLTYRLVFSIYV